MRTNIKYFGILALGLLACEPEFENPVNEPGAYTSGEANFVNYVALGNSMTAGFADNALYITGQENSFPNILAQQFAKVQATGEFRIPYMNDNAGGLLFNGEPNPRYSNRLVLETLIVDGETVQAPKVYTGAAPTTDVLTQHLDGMFNNMGVPGAKSYHLLAPKYGDPAGLAAQPATANPYFVRFASSPETSVIQDALAQNPTFFSLWIGNNDILGYATGGGANEADITTQEVFTQAYTGLVTQLTANDTDGVLLNIPNVTDIPYFTTVPYAPLDPTNPSYGPMIPVLNEQFGLLSQAIVGIRQVDESAGDTEFSIEFNPAGASPVVVFDEDLPNIAEPLAQTLASFGMDASEAALLGQLYGQARQATPEDLLVLTSSGVIGTVNTERVQTLMQMGVDQETAGLLSVNGITYPLEDKWVLTPEEQETVSTTVAGYNQVIKSLADTHGLAHVDASELLETLAIEGYSFDGGMITSEFGSGGAFSLDGVHLTPRGNAFVANKIIDAINATYHASVPKVNIGNYATITPSNEVN